MICTKCENEPRYGTRIIGLNCIRQENHERRVAAGKLAKSPKVKGAMLDQAKELYAAGHTLLVVANALGVSRTALARTLVNNGVTLRSKGRLQNNGTPKPKDAPEMHDEPPSLGWNRTKASEYLSRSIRVAV